MSIANFFRRPHYVSDTTAFIEELKQKKPDVDLGQRQGRALLWDKQIDRRLQSEFQAGKVKQTPYVYYQSMTGSA